MSPRRSPVYEAIAHPTRRRILHLLGREEMSVNDLAARFPVTRPAISQHLGSLRQAGLVERRREGRTLWYRARPEPLREVIDWISHFDAFWDDKLAALDRHLSEDR